MPIAKLATAWANDRIFLCVDLTEWKMNPRMPTF